MSTDIFFLIKKVTYFQCLNQQTLLQKEKKIDESIFSFIIIIKKVSGCIIVYVNLINWEIG